VLFGGFYDIINIYGVILVIFIDLRFFVAEDVFYNFQNNKNKM
jgi:hypothetical protein